jgi:NDP-sugar pyrophosphorylase family protein/lipopolysaccharide/colanic/teichoic acid biosynthesis glycosyltransferase
MKAMILAAGLGERLKPLTLTIPKPMLPVCNKPVMEYSIELCKKHNIKDIKINVHYLPEQIDKYFGDGSKFGANISYSIEKNLCGTSGALKRVRSFFKETFLVLTGDSYHNINLTDLLNYHKESKSIATICVKKSTANRKDWKAELDGHKLKSIQEIENIKDDYVNCGVYIFEPEIFEHIPDKSYSSILQDLLPGLLAKNIDVNCYITDEEWSNVDSLEEYWDLNMRLCNYNLADIHAGEKLKEGIYIHPSVKFNNLQLENFKPPIIIGENTEICKGVKLEGPLVLGKELFIDENASLSKSVVLSNTYVGKDVEIKESVVNKNYHLSVPSKFGMYVDDDNVLKSHQLIPFKTKFNLFLINATDRIVAFFALLFLSPIFTVTAILIKLDSKGPVFYISKRLKAPEIENKGNHLYVYFKEKAVKYYVFRTMYVDADQRIKELKNKYDTGPFRKIENDPRVTKVGKILRKTSIDELPLLWNVLKGQMSLVGIWALPTYEAKELLDKGLKSEIENGVIDLSDVAQVRFQGKLGLAGFWQARGRSNLTAEERALHDTYQSVMENISHEDEEYLGEYTEFKTYKGYLKMLFETFKSVIKREGAV